MVLDYARARGIEEVLHFTTNRGLIGMLALGKLLSHDQLREEELLTEIAFPNSPNRNRDAAWTDYVNMSITAVNSRFMTSSRGWHSEDAIWWAILAFNPNIVAHEGVYFATSNNAYESTNRAAGVEGLKALYADSVRWGQYKTNAFRSPGMSLAEPTENQAEVLYPNALDLMHLRTIYVADEENIDDVAGFIAALRPELHTVAIVCTPSQFVTR